MNDIEKLSEIRNATILMVLAGTFNIYFGYQSYQLSIIIPDPFPMIVGTTMIGFGVLTFCTSMAVWQQKSWATKIIAGVGFAICVTLVIFGYYLMIFIVAPIYGVAIDQLRNRRVIEHSGWHEN